MVAFNPIASGPLAASGGANYALSVTSGTFTLSMQGAAKLITDIYPSGNFSLSGTQVVLNRGTVMSAQSGLFTLTLQQDATLGFGRGFTADSGAFSLSGQNAIITAQYNIGATSGAFSVFGQTQAYIIDVTLITDNGSFALTPSELDRLGADYRIALGSQSFSASGSNLDRLGANYTVSGSELKYSHTGHIVKFRGFFSAYVSPEIWQEQAEAPDAGWTEPSGSGGVWVDAA